MLTIIDTGQDITNNQPDNDNDNDNDKDDDKDKNDDKDEDDDKYGTHPTLGWLTMEMTNTLEN